MRRILAMAGVLILLAGIASGAEWRFGPQAGVNGSGLKGDSPSGVRVGKKYGLAAGFIGEIRLTGDVWLSVQPLYLERGTTTQISVSGQTEKVEGPSLSMEFVAFPVLARIVSDNGRTYVAGGLNPSFLLDAKLHDGDSSEDLSSAFKGFDLAADIGFGLMVPIGNPTLSFELRYEQSILNLASSSRTEDDDILPVRFRSSGFQFLAGLLWPLGGK
jgi:Outer membrane protein beta-barrel domain